MQKKSRGRSDDPVLGIALQFRANKKWLWTEEKLMVKYVILFIMLTSKLAFVGLNADPAAQPWGPDPICVPGDDCDDDS